MRRPQCVERATSWHHAFLYPSLYYGANRDSNERMKTVPLDVQSIRVIVPRPNWSCDINELPIPKMSAETAEGSQVTESYEGETDEYTVTVHSNMNERMVEVHDKNNQEINDFEIVF